MDQQKARQQVQDVLGPALGRQELRPQRNTCVTALLSPARQPTLQVSLQYERFFKQLFNCYIMELVGEKSAMFYIFKRIPIFPSEQLMSGSEAFLPVHTTSAQDTRRRQTNYREGVFMLVCRTRVSPRGHVLARPQHCSAHHPLNHPLPFPAALPPATHGRG